MVPTEFKTSYLSLDFRAIDGKLSCLFSSNKLTSNNNCGSGTVHTRASGSNKAFDASQILTLKSKPISLFKGSSVSESG